MQRPGRLGDDKTRFETDVRADPRIADIVKLTGGFGAGLDPLAADATYTECLDYCMAFERIETQAHAALLEIVPHFDDIEITRESIVATDGHEITDYEAYVNGRDWISTGATGSPAVVKDLLSGNTYEISLRGVNAEGEGFYFRVDSGHVALGYRRRRRAGCH